MHRISCPHDKGCKKQVETRSKVVNNFTRDYGDAIGNACGLLDAKDIVPKVIVQLVGNDEGAGLRLEKLVYFAFKTDHALLSTFNFGFAPPQ